MFGLKRGAAFADPAALFPAPVPSSPFVVSKGGKISKSNNDLVNVSNTLETTNGLEADVYTTTYAGKA
jgi:methionyl-tRNA synthetase